MTRYKIEARWLKKGVLFSTLKVCLIDRLSGEIILKAKSRKKLFRKVQRWLKKKKISSMIVEWRVSHVRIQQNGSIYLDYESCVDSVFSKWPRRGTEALRASYARGYE